MGGEGSGFGALIWLDDGTALRRNRQAMLVFLGRKVVLYRVRKRMRYFNRRGEVNDAGPLQVQDLPLLP